MTIGAAMVAFSTWCATSASSTRAEVARRASNSSSASSWLPLKLSQATAPSTASSAATVPPSSSARIERTAKG